MKFGHSRACARHSASARRRANGNLGLSGEYRVLFEYGFLLEFTPYLIRGSNDRYGRSQFS
jgi:hypothetical protein